MEGKKKKSGIKTAIIFLYVLLAISVTALAVTLAYRYFDESAPSSVTVPDNIITPQEDVSPDEAPAVETETEAVPGETEENGEPSVQPSAEADETKNNAGNKNDVQQNGSITVTTGGRNAAVLSLYDRNPGDNIPFNVKNMFPGDKETKHYCVKVSYSNSVTVRFRANVRPGYEKLAEVMKCRVTLLSTGEVLYDGLMLDMPKSVNHTLTSSGSTVDELYYEITAYLDTSVGNEYQNKSLVADFCWWVEGKSDIGNLESNPGTGAPFGILLCAGVGTASLAAIAALVFVKKRGEKEERQ